MIRTVASGRICSPYLEPRIHHTPQAVIRVIQLSAGGAAFVAVSLRFAEVRKTVLDLRRTPYGNIQSLRRQAYVPHA